MAAISLTIFSFQIAFIFTSLLFTSPYLITSQQIKHRQLLPQCSSKPEALMKKHKEHNK